MAAQTVDVCQCGGTVECFPAQGASHPAVVAKRCRQCGAHASRIPEPSPTQGKEVV